MTRLHIGGLFKSDLITFAIDCDRQLLQRLLLLDVSCIVDRSLASLYLRQLPTSYQIELVLPYYLSNPNFSDSEHYTAKFYQILIRLLNEHSRS